MERVMRWWNSELYSCIVLQSSQNWLQLRYYDCVEDSSF